MLFIGPNWALVTTPDPGEQAVVTGGGPDHHVCYHVTPQHLNGNSNSQVLHFTALHSFSCSHTN